MADLLSWLGKRAQGIEAQLNPFDNGQTYDTVVNNRPVPRPTPQPAPAPRQPAPQPANVGAVNRGLDAGKSWETIANETQTPLEQVRQFSQATRPNYGIKPAENPVIGLAKAAAPVANSVIKTVTPVADMGFEALGRLTGNKELQKNANDQFYADVKQSMPGAIVGGAIDSAQTTGKAYANIISAAKEALDGTTAAQKQAIIDHITQANQLKQQLENNGLLMSPEGRQRAINQINDHINMANALYSQQAQDLQRINYENDPVRVAAAGANLIGTVALPGAGKVAGAVAKPLEMITPAGSLIPKAVGGAIEGALVNAGFGAVNQAQATGLQTTANDIKKAAIDSLIPGAIFGGAVPFMTEQGPKAFRDLTRPQKTAALTAAAEGKTTRTMPISKLTPTDITGYGDLDPARVQFYKKQIADGKNTGPILAMRGEDGKLYVEDGKHRLEASRQLGKKAVPVRVVTPADLKRISQGGYIKVPGAGSDELAPARKSGAKDIATPENGSFQGESQLQSLSRPNAQIASSEGSIDPLAALKQEALKYGSADEFIKANNGGELPSILDKKGQELRKVYYATHNEQKVIRRATEDKQLQSIRKNSGPTIEQRKLTADIALGKDKLAVELNKVNAEIDKINNKPLETQGTRQDLSSRYWKGQQSRDVLLNRKQEIENALQHLDDQAHAEAGAPSLNTADARPATEASPASQLLPQSQPATERQVLSVSDQPMRNMGAAQDHPVEAARHTNALSSENTPKTVDITTPEGATIKKIPRTRQEIDEAIFKEDPSLLAAVNHSAADEPILNERGTSAIPKFHVDDLKHYGYNEDIPARLKRTTGPRDIDLIAKRAGYDDVDAYMKAAQQTLESRENRRVAMEMVRDMRKAYRDQAKQYPLTEPGKVSVKGPMGDEAYQDRYGKTRTGEPVKVKPFAKPQFDFTQWKDKSAIGLGRETMERNLERVAGKDAEAAKSLLVDSSRKNETARAAFTSDLRRQTRQAVVKDLGIKAGSQESALVQRYGEKLIDKSELVKQVGETKAANIIKASDYFRKQYDQLIDDWNTVRRKYGYDPIPKREDYFRHFQAISNNASILGVIKNARDLPTEISGITDIFEPSKPFSDAALQRKGDKTTFDAVGGFDNYLNSVSRQIFHTDTVQKGRALEKAIRTAAAEHPELQLPNFVANLHEWTNLVSGKKTRIDRAAEQLVGRKVYAATNAIKSKTGANMVGANISSALTNFIPFTQSLATTTKAAAVRGIVDTLGSPFSKDPGVIDGVPSSFLQRRFQEEATQLTGVRKASDIAAVPFKAVDEFTSRSIVAGKYYENLSKGMNKQAAMKAADDYAARIITDRSVGQLPNLLQTQTTGFLTQFQAEVNNQVSFLTRDIPQFAGGNKLKAANSIAQFVLFSYLFNTAYQKVTGRRPQLDPIDATMAALDPNKSTDEKWNAFSQDILGGLPGASLAFGGRLPASAIMPDMGSLTRGVMDATKGDVGATARDLYQGVAGPLFYGAPPFGGGQLKKTIDAGIGMTKGYSETPSGNVRFPMDNLSPTDTARGLVFGQYATTPGQQYTNGTPKPLSPNQSDTYKSLKAGNPQDAHDYLGSILGKRGNGQPAPNIGSVVKGVSDLSKQNADKRAKLKASLSATDYSISQLSKKDQQKLVDNGTITQDKLNGLRNYVINKKKELGIDISAGPAIAPNLDKKYSSVLQSYGSLSTDDRGKLFSSQKDAEFKYEEAKYQNDKAQGTISDVEDIKRRKSLEKLRVGAGYDKQTRDLYGLSKADIYDYVSKYKGGDELAKQLTAYDQALYDAGLTSYLKFKTGIAPAARGRSSSKSGGKSSGRKKSTKGSTNSGNILPTLQAAYKVSAPKVAAFAKSGSAVKAPTFQAGQLRHYTPTKSAKITASQPHKR